MFLFLCRTKYETSWYWGSITVHCSKFCKVCTVVHKIFSQDYLKSKFRQVYPIINIIYFCFFKRNCTVVNSPNLVTKSLETFGAEHPKRPRAPAWASIIDAPTGVPAGRSNSFAAETHSPEANFVPGVSTTLPILSQLFSSKSSRPICWK